MTPTEPNTTQPLRTPLKIALTYIIAAGLWILFSDHLLGLFSPDPATLTRLQTYKGWLFVVVTGGLLYACLYHHLRREQRAEDLTVRLQKTLAGAGVGESYFAFLAKQLNEMLNVDGCLIGEWRPKSASMAILAGAPAGFLGDASTYSLHGTPCEKVLKEGQALTIPNGVGAAYPRAGFFKHDPMESYLGVPLLDVDGTAIGLLAVASTKPMVTPATTRRLLETCASRASSELQRMRSERRLREQFNQFTTLFDSINAIIYVADLKTHELLYVNRFAAEQFGHDWPDRTCYSYLQADRQQPCEFCTNNSLLTDGKPGEAVIWEFCNTKDKQWYQCIDKAIHWTDGRLVRMEIALNITERKELETIKDNLLSAVSHEMRTPLTAITGFTELLLDEQDLPRHVTRHLQTIFMEAEKLGDLINTFIDVRRFKTDRARVDYRLQALAPLLNKAAMSCRDRKEHHHLQVDCPDSLTIYGNTRELEQVFSQLLSNACRYSPQGGDIMVTAETETDNVLITISDQGIGIPPEEHRKIFDRFYKLDTGDSRRTSGAGLGLTLAREIITLHGGRIWLESQPEQGSRFFVALPTPPAATPPSLTR